MAKKKKAAVRAAPVTGRPYLFGQAVTAYARRGRRGRTTLRLLVELHRRFGREPVADVTSAVVSDYIDERLRDGVAGSTVRREVTTFMAVLKQAHLSGYLGAVPTVVRPPEAEPRLRTLNEVELGMLTTGKGTVQFSAVRFLVQTGCRIGEMVALKWSDVDLKEWVVTFRTRKGTGRLRERRVPLNNGAFWSLEEMAKLPAQPDGRVFPWTNTAAASAAVGKYMKDCGVEDCTPHDLRRTFASRLLARGTDVRTVADLLGHSSLKMVMQYALPTSELKRDAVKKLEEPT